MHDVVYKCCRCAHLFLYMFHANVLQINSNAHILFYFSGILFRSRFAGTRVVDSASIPNDCESDCIGSSSGHTQAHTSTHRHNWWLLTIHGSKLITANFDWHMSAAWCEMRLSHCIKYYFHVVFLCFHIACEMHRRQHTVSRTQPICNSNMVVWLFNMRVDAFPPIKSYLCALEWAVV